MLEGEGCSIQVDITEEMVCVFADFSGDMAPLHTSNEFAIKMGFKKCVVHGAILFSMMSRFVGMYLPGPKSIWLANEIKFHKPCYAPCTITITGTTKQVSQSTSSVIVDIAMVDNSGAVIATAKSYHKLLM